MRDLVLVCGIPSEAPLAMLLARLEALDVPHVVLSQRRFAATQFFFEIRNGHICGELALDGERYPLERVSGAYTRLMDEQQLPELEGEPPESAFRRQARTWHRALGQWLDIAPIRVVNRTAAMASNCSKPFQAQAILRHGFRIPETLITSDPDLAREFIATRRAVIFKSTSGVRSIVQRVGEDDLRRLDRIRWCPVQFQEYVDGRNVRVHVVGQEIFATGIETGATDYRYAHRQTGEAAVLEAVDLADDVAGRCLALAGALDLPFAGIDSKMAPDGGVYCFEVNPSPAYSYYESHTGQPISDALARYLAGRDDD